MKLIKLPNELRLLVKQSVFILGQMIQYEVGNPLYQKIEKLRTDMNELRSLSDIDKCIDLLQHYKVLCRLSKEEQFEIAHAFSLMLELINTCENAYRTFRLKQPSVKMQKIEVSKKPQAILYVLTAHPTEARSPSIIYLFYQIQNLLIEALESGFERIQSELRHLLEIAWRLSSSRERKPSVRDEAEHIYSTVLREDLIRALLDQSPRLAPFFIRSWVGGDKDGHPGVDECTMIDSFQISRGYLIKFVEGCLSEVKATLVLLKATIKETSLASQLLELKKSIHSLRELRKGDGALLKSLHRKMQEFDKDYQALLGVSHPAHLRLLRLLKSFPGLVVPLELRESADLIQKAAFEKPTSFRPHSHSLGTIERMLQKLKQISKGGQPEWYAGELIISMVSSWEDMHAAAILMKRTLGNLLIPIVPLFETNEALSKAPSIMSRAIQNPIFKEAIHAYWKGHLEMMLGYSDSAKQIGVLPSRFAIRKAVCDLDALCLKFQITPIFFHGSGGSIDRGGGSIHEQTDWWPKSAISFYKATLQGEMIARGFASQEIFLSQLEKIVGQLGEQKGATCAPEAPKTVQKFIDHIRLAYREQIESQDFMRLLEDATPYRYLSALKLGSRPVVRSGKINHSPVFSSLRAIPWVLCWTQTRVLFPTWWGVGSAWVNLDPKERRSLMKYYQQDLLFKSLVKNLGFTLAKVELSIWTLYLNQSGLNSQQIKDAIKIFSQEFKNAVSFVQSITGEKDLLWYRPWLGESIKLRSPMIHPLNLLQIIALRQGDLRLIRETVTGISSGMLTTG